ncbi:MAG: CHAT domain-containing protein [Desulfobacteraceae bacterium]|nr:CHAT domain-containing protein [Desulfobacteraceae bacterium]
MGIRFFSELSRGFRFYPQSLEWGDSAQLLGEKLYSVLNMCEFDKVLKDASSKNPVHLIFSGDIDTFGIPWELIHDGKEYISNRFAISRNVFHPETKYHLQFDYNNPPFLSHSDLEKKLNVLLIKSNISFKNGSFMPECYAVNEREDDCVNCEIDELKDFFVQNNNSVEVADTYDKFLRYINNNQWDIIHYIGPSFYSPSGIWMENNNWNGKFVKAKELCDYFNKKRFPNLKFVYLNCCEGATTYSEKKWPTSLIIPNEIGIVKLLMSTKKVLPENKVPSILAYRWKISSNVRAKFAIDFYRFFFKGDNKTGMGAGSLRESLYMAKKENKYPDDYYLWVTPILTVYGETPSFYNSITVTDNQCKGGKDDLFKTSEIQQVQIDSRESETVQSSQHIYILHLSDIHLSTSDQAITYRTQLETDLKHNVELKQLDYLVISGDIANNSKSEEYKAALELVEGIAKRFRLDPERIVTVPGNHDLNWDISAKAYEYVPIHQLPDPLPEEYIPAGLAGALKPDSERYRKRFANFSKHFYKKIYNKEYPSDYSEQGILYFRPHDRILFMGINSCWNIDHNFKNRSGIHSGALTNAISQILSGSYSDWLKIAVWHHPIAGVKRMKDISFLSQLEANGFQICMHGHMQEVPHGSYLCDHGIHFVGAGKSGEPANEQVTGIPYNLLLLDTGTRTITVKTGNKEGAWGDRGNKKIHYTIDLKETVNSNLKMKDS